MILLIAGFILLHGPDGKDVWVHADHVTSLRASGPGPTKENEKLFPSQAQCMVGLVDGKYAAVREPCEAIRKKLEEAK